MFDINPLSTTQRLKEIDSFFAAGATESEAQRPRRPRLARLPGGLAATLVVLLGTYLVV